MWHATSLQEGNHSCYHALAGTSGTTQIHSELKWQAAGASPLPLLRLLLVLNWASPGFLQSREPPCFLWLQSELSCLHRLGPSSSQYVLFLFRIHTDFLKGRFPETTTRSDLLETLAQIAFLWEGHSPLMAFYLHLSQRSAPQGLGSIHCYFYVLSTNQKAQHPSDTK